MKRMMACLLALFWLFVCLPSLSVGGVPYVTRKTEMRPESGICIGAEASSLVGLLGVGYCRKWANAYFGIGLGYYGAPSWQISAEATAVCPWFLVSARGAYTETYGDGLVVSYDYGHRKSQMAQLGTEVLKAWGNYLFWMGCQGEQRTTEEWAYFGISRPASAATLTPTLGFGHAWQNNSLEISYAHKAFKYLVIVEKEKSWQLSINDTHRWKRFRFLTDLRVIPEEMIASVREGRPNAVYPLPGGFGVKLIYCL